MDKTRKNNNNNNNNKFYCKKNDYKQNKVDFNQKKKNERRSPSEQVIGDKNYIIDRSLGLVFY